MYRRIRHPIVPSTALRFVAIVLVVTANAVLSNAGLPSRTRAQTGQGSSPPPASAAEAPAPARSPWRIADALRSPAWLHVGATQWIRYEHLHHPFRAGAVHDDHGLSLRTTLDVEVEIDSLEFGVEVVDARIHLTDAETPLDTTSSDPFDILQAYVGAELPDVFLPGAVGRVRAGRMTMDVGSRRFVARNRFRNTINAFTGVDLEWTTAASDHVRVFATVPVRRLPDEGPRLARNEVELDRENVGTIMWGAFYGSRAWHAGVRLEAYVLGLREQDRVSVATRNRRLLTPGFRMHRPAERGDVDVEVEAAGQLGRSRATTRAEDEADLDHLAVFAHLSLGYTGDAVWRPRIVLQYDYASGDADPEDGANGRFDPLFGARRFELGPTGLYGALARSNLNAPGARAEVRPHEMVDGFVAYRGVWLAQRRDAWTTSGLRDVSGSSGAFVGHQLEASIRWRPLVGNVTIDVGGATLVRGRFAKTAPNAGRGGDPAYVYGQVGFEI